MQHCREITTVRVENEWLCIRAVRFVFIYLDLMCNHPFWTLPVVISQQCCIDNQNIYNTNNHMCLWCVHNDMLNSLVKHSFVLLVCLFVLRFYDQVNPMGSCQAPSIYLIICLLGGLSIVHILSFFRQKLTTALLESAEGRE